MIDTTFTTVDWQLHSGDVVVLPVGSVEQHDGHLPLETDCIEAGYFARRLAEQLDAAPAGRPIYSRLGFRDLGQILRLTGMANLEGIEMQAAEVRPLDQNGLERMISKDQAIAGCDRSVLFNAFYSRYPGLAMGIYRDGKWQGFCLGREGNDFRQIGPVISENAFDAMTLISASVQIRPAASVLLDVPAAHRDIVAPLVKAGMTVQRGFSRMVYGKEAAADIVNGWFACAGPEFG